MTTLQLAAPPPSVATADTTFSRVLLAIDFGSASLSAARWATTHVAPDAHAILMHVVPFTDRQRGDAKLAASDDSLQRMTPAVAGGLGGFAATLNVASTRSLVRIGQPSGSLAAAANDAEVSLLVLGRRADANRVRVGEPNVIERAVRRTSASVLVVPEGTVHGPDHVFAAVDESRFAPRVLEVASRLARMHEVPLVILHVLSPVAGAYERVMRSAKHQLSRVGGLKRGAVARPATPAPLSLATTRWLIQLGQAHNVLGRDSTDVAVGDPAREITSMAMKRESPLVVVGLRGADEAPLGSIGSVARELLTRGPMPVLAVNSI